MKLPKRFLGFLGLLGLLVVILVCATFAYRHYPRRVNSAAELDSLVGRRIRMTAEFDGDDKAWDLLHFDGQTLMVVHVTGSFEWPTTGQTISVIGRLERYRYPGLDAKFAVTDATWEF